MTKDDIKLLREAAEFTRKASGPFATRKAWEDYQHAASPSRILALLARLEKYEGALSWISMNCGIAGDGNHADPLQAHRDSSAKAKAALQERVKALEDGLDRAASVMHAHFQAIRCGSTDASGLFIGCQTARALLPSTPASEASGKRKS